MPAKSTKSDPEQEAHEAAQQHFADLEAKYQEYIKLHPDDVVISTEAAVSVNWYAIAPTGENCQFTIRSNAVIDDFLHVLEVAGASFEALAAGGFTPKAVGKGSENYQPASAPKAAAPEAPKQPQYTNDEQEAPSFKYPPDAQLYNAVRVDILPQPDGKVKVEIYGDDIRQPVNQYPSFRYTGKPKEAAILFAGVGLGNEAEFQRAQQVAGVRWLVYWKEGREFTKPSGGTGHYKDILGVELAQ